MKKLFIPLSTVAILIAPLLTEESQVDIPFTATQFHKQILDTTKTKKENENEKTKGGKTETRSPSRNETHSAGGVAG